MVSEPLLVFICESVFYFNTFWFYVFQIVEVVVGISAVFGGVIALHIDTLMYSPYLYISIFWVLAVVSIKTLFIIVIIIGIMLSSILLYTHIYICIVKGL